MLFILQIRSRDVNIGLFLIITMCCVLLPITITVNEWKKRIKNRWVIFSNSRTFYIVNPLFIHLLLCGLKYRIYEIKGDTE